MNLKKILPIVLVLPLVAGCGKTPSKNKSSGSDSFSSTSESSLSNQQGSTSEQGSSISSGSSSSSSSSTSTSIGPAPGPTDQQYLDEFNSLKTSIKNNHNYTITVHSYLKGYESDPDCVVDDSIFNINDQIFGFNGEYSGVQSGYVKQGNQGYVYFDYAPALGVETDGFYSTNASVGISSIFDAVAENLYLGSYTQEHQRFTTTNTNVKAVVANFTGFDVRVLNEPESIYMDVNVSNHTLAIHAEYMVYFFDEQEVNTPVVFDGLIENIGTTHHTALESYLSNPTDTYVSRSAWNQSELDLFELRNAGFVPQFPGATSYSIRLGEYTDKDEPTSHIIKAVCNNFECGDITSSYVTYLTENELFQEVTSFRKNTRLFKRVLTDTTAMTKTTNTVELAFEAASTRFPQGVMSILYGGYVENIDITTVQIMNEYFLNRGYTAFVPQLNLNGSTQVSHFSDETDNKNASEHLYELYTSLDPIRIHIASYSDAVAAIEAYGNLLKQEAYGFTKEAHNPLTKQVTFTNDVRYNNAYVVMSDVAAIGESSYSGYVELRYYLEKEIDPSDTPTLVKIQIDTACKTDFILGEDFSYGSGVIRALYTSGDWSSNIIAECDFTGYNKNQTGDQTITVSYEEGGILVSTTYTVHVESTRIYTLEFSKYGDAITLEINLCDDGTGTYTLTRYGTTTPVKTSWKQYFRYVIDGSTITFTLAQEYQSTNFTRFSLFAGETVDVTTRVGTYDSVNDTIWVMISTSSGTQEITSFSPPIDPLFTR